VWESSEGIEELQGNSDRLGAALGDLWRLASAGSYWFFYNFNGLELSANAGLLSEVRGAPFLLQIAAAHRREPAAFVLALLFPESFSDRR
jgi:hypothetical protein